MIRWLLYYPLSVLCYLLGLLLNPVVVLFADENGELHGPLHYWQTWDDSLDAEYFMRSVCPACLDYGFDEHYTTYSDTDEWTAKYGKIRKFSLARPDAKWTTKQYIQRYFCRVWWLYRNCAYGFMMYLLGADLSKAVYKTQEPDKFYCTDGKAFCYKNEQRICSWLSWKIYIGWKTYPNNDNALRCMYANRIWFKFGK